MRQEIAKPIALLDWPQRPFKKIPNVHSEWQLKFIPFLLIINQKPPCVGFGKE
jgi:hypothetical protein